MGIPVPSKRNNKVPPMPPGPGIPYDPRIPPRIHYKRSDGGEVMENELPPTPQHPEEQFKRGNGDMSRMGNYFNIVIAPPSMKAMPRKMLSNDYRMPPKRYSS